MWVASSKIAIKPLLQWNLAVHSIGSCFFYIHPATAALYPLSLHDALPISAAAVDRARGGLGLRYEPARGGSGSSCRSDRKSTRLNSSHGYISYAVFCLKKKKTSV